MVEGQEGVTWTEWVALARTCEAHGIPKLFRSDHYLNLGGVAERGSLDAWGTLCALAAVTSTLRLGTLVSPATFRHPSELAKLVTTADRISDGRVELGLGAGWHDREHDAHIDNGRPRGVAIGIQRVGGGEHRRQHRQGDERTGDRIGDLGGETDPVGEHAAKMSCPNDRPDENRDSHQHPTDRDRRETEVRGDEPGVG